MREKHDGQGFTLIRHAPHDTFSTREKGKDYAAALSAAASPLTPTRWQIA